MYPLVTDGCLASTPKCCTKILCCLVVNVSLANTSTFLPAFLYRQVAAVSWQEVARQRKGGEGEHLEVWQLLSYEVLQSESFKETNKHTFVILTCEGVLRICDLRLFVSDGRGGSEGRGDGAGKPDRAGAAEARAGVHRGPAGLRHHPHQPRQHGRHGQPLPHGHHPHQEAPQKVISNSCSPTKLCGQMEPGPDLPPGSCGLCQGCHPPPSRSLHSCHPGCKMSCMT